MGVVIKQSFWGTALAYLGLLVGYVNVLYFRAEYFNLEQIGIFTLVTANAMMISPLSSFGAGSTFLKFFPSFQQLDIHKLFSFLFLTTLAGNTIIILIIWLLKDQIAERYVEAAPAYIDFLTTTIVVILVNSFFDLFYSYSRSILKIVFPSFLRDIFLRCGSLLLVYGFALNWWSFDGAVTGLGIIYSLAFSFLFFQLFIVHKFRFDFNFDVITKNWKSDFLRFGSYSMLLAGSFAILNNATYDQITTTLGADANGIFATCFFLAIVVELPRRNMAKVISPILSSEFGKNDMKEVGNIYKKSSITMSVIGMLIFIGIVTNLNDLFEFIPKGESFEAGFWIVVSVCFVKLLLMVSSFAGEIINYSHLYKYNLLFQVIAAITLITLNHFMIATWGLNGAAFSYAVAVLIHILFKMVFVRMHFKMHPFMKSHIPLTIIGIIVIVGAYNFQLPYNPLLAIVIRSLLTIIVFATLIYRFRISDDINKIIHSTFERFLKVNLPK